MGDEKRRDSAAFGKLIAERQNARSVQMCYFDQRDELSPKIQGKIAAEWQECFQLRRETGGQAAGLPVTWRVFFLWLSVFVLVRCWSKQSSAKRWGDLQGDRYLRPRPYRLCPSLKNTQPVTAETQLFLLTRWHF